jgi:hypothetical protein
VEGLSDMALWNGAFMRKRGWNDEAAETLNRRTRESGLSDRDDIRTMFDCVRGEEARGRVRRRPQCPR